MVTSPRGCACRTLLDANTSPTILKTTRAALIGILTLRASASSVLCRSLDVVDDEDLHGFLGGQQLQPQLLFQGRKQTRAAVVGIWSGGLGPPARSHVEHSRNACLIADHLAQSV